VLQALVRVAEVHGLDPAADGRQAHAEGIVRHEVGDRGGVRDRRAAAVEDRVIGEHQLQRLEIAVDGGAEEASKHRLKITNERSFVKRERPIAKLRAMPGRRSAVDALETRASILRHAADIASVEGLEGLTIGRLAAELDMSKSGVIGQFGSKEELQLATLEYAADVFRQQVWEPVQHYEPGLQRLLGVCESWTSYADRRWSAGGCFIAAAQFEWDGRVGRVHDALAAWTRMWRDALVSDIEQAVADGDLPADTQPQQAAYSLEALAAGMNPARQLQGDTDAAAWSLQAMHAVLRIA
jgi:AcrR family transcriptional regulator